jgi:hypothetical protein
VNALRRSGGAGGRFATRAQCWDNRFFDRFKTTLYFQSTD